MRRAVAVLAVLVLWSGGARADVPPTATVPADSVLADTMFRDSGGPLTADEAESLEGVVWPVGLDRGDSNAARRFYLAPIVGAAWGQLLVGGDSVLDRPLFGAGGAAGIAISRPQGQLRLEFEGLYRDGFSETWGAPFVIGSVGATDNWSALVNVWRDVSLTEKFGVYGGGGIGAGGYNLGLHINFLGADFQARDQIAAFAWQVGGGFLYAVSERVTLDLGYRYYAVGPSETTFIVTAPPAGPTLFGRLPHEFLASELMLTVRIYEPFQRWRR